MAGIDRSLSSEGLSLYKLLDLEKTATDNEIKKAYHKKALRCHPDKNPGDSAKAEEFQKINNASNILRDERKRKVYDKMGSQGLQIIDTAGLEVAEAIMKYDSPWYKAIFITCFCFTGCCFGCCCCCFLCCCCCGKLKPKQDTEDPLIPESDDEKEEGNNHATTTMNSPDHEPVTSPPKSTEPTTNQPSSTVFAMPPPGDSNTAAAVIAMPPPENSSNPTVIAMPPPE